MNIKGIPDINHYATPMAKQTQARNKANKLDEITNPVKKDIVDTVEITNLSNADKVELERRAALDKVSPKEALMAALTTAPNNDDVERSKALAAKFAPIQNKMFSGKKLTAEEKQFLQKHYPEFATTAQRIEQEIEQLRNQVKHSKSKEDANRLIMEKKIQLMNSGNKDGFLLFMMPAIDEAFQII